MSNVPLYRAIAISFNSSTRCLPEFRENHIQRILDYTEFFPHGSGFDDGTTIDLKKSTPERLVFYTSYHHMNDAGIYTGWTDHKVVITPSLLNGVKIRVTGRNKNDIKDYIEETFHEILNIIVNQYTGEEIKE